mgnify:CR=1 FL=1
MNTIYVQGFSTSMPHDIQEKMVHSLPGLENCTILKYAYAIEYDAIDPLQLWPSLETKDLKNLFTAGQINGTTGYEEAAAQGLMAGINASLLVQDKSPFILNRDESYIGVLIDDLITKGVDEPYRMFTSRAEYRILLRQDNADFRLTSKSHEIGLADEFRYSYTSRKYDRIQQFVDFSGSNNITAIQANDYLQSIGETPIKESKLITDIVSRPEVKYASIIKNVPRGTKLLNELNGDIELIPDSTPYSFGEVDSNKFTSLYDAYQILSFNQSMPISDDTLTDYRTKVFENYSREILDNAEILLKYRGYIVREKQLADKISHLESLIIPDEYDYDKISGLSIECRQKLKRYLPRTIGQASRISGVSPSDISILLIHFGR